MKALEIAQGMEAAKQWASTSQCDTTIYQEVQTSHQSRWKSSEWCKGQDKDKCSGNHVTAVE